MSKEDDIDKKIIDFTKHAKIKGRPIRQVDAKDNAVVMGDVNITDSMKGNNSAFLVGGKLEYHAQKPPSVKILPPPGSIGSDPYLKQRITELFNKIGESREKRFGKNAYSVMYNKFKKDFGIKNQPWTIIWTWPRNCADTIIEYLDCKYGKTIPGRMENAAFPPRPVLYQQENDLLPHFGLEHGSPEVRQLMQIMFGVTSHKHLTHLQHWQFVKYLEEQVDKITGE